ncbi:MAG: hypothetical protein ACFFD1_13470, partial [Candidatus Thorarchaeota archaeon]
MLIALLFFLFLFGNINLYAYQDTTSTDSNSLEWEERESQHFIAIYREIDAPLIPHILESAENALIPLMKIFHYKPSEKIIINTFDIYDFGFAS